MKKTFALVTALVMASSFVISINANAAGNVANGKKIYAQSCATCHGVTGKGDTPIANSLNPKPRNFVEGKFKYGNKDADLVKIISNGKGAMPPWKAALKPAQIDDVVAYIRSLKKK